MVLKLDKIFDSTSKNFIFKDKYMLQSNYTPQTIPHRDKEIEQVAAILAPSLKGERPSNLFVYGKTGCGKTLSVQYVKEELLKRVKNSGVSLKIEYLNCKLRKVSDTEYRILAEFIKKLGGKVPATGLPTDAVYNQFIEMIDKEKQLLILVLDEVDQVVKKIPESNFLYNLTRLNTELKNAQICLVGISNDLRFLDNLDPRVRSSLSEEEIVFQSYNALQLQDILRERAESAFQAGAMGDGVIEKCAAFAAREHGDARRALDLLRVAGEVAERGGASKIDLKHIDSANSKIERDKILDVVESEPKQFQLTLLAMMELLEKSDKVFTGDVYRTYQELCKKTHTEILTQRRVSSIISEYDMQGLINAKNVSRGTYGKTREIRSAIPKEIEQQAKSTLIEALSL
ncbi:cell division control protein Cdc6 [Candidatus Pacearchaeota archaeon RBG_13_36_9]|nr:MAG: cell division control protein Cdc6 [Candidatus Pacearchaeota archaeon RBG_13_36_9]